MQKITIIGRLGRDASIRETQDGGKVVSFTVAVNGRFRGVEKTSWYDVSTFNYDRYKNMVKYLTKGSGVVVIGDLDCDLDEGRDGVTRCRRSITADSIEFNSNGTSGNTQNNTSTEVSAEKKPRKVEADPEDVAEEVQVTVTKPKAKKKPAAAPVVEEVEAETEDEDTDNDEEDGDLPF